jgi:hypothetical protein
MFEPISARGVDSTRHTESFVLGDPLGLTTQTTLIIRIAGTERFALWVLLETHG